MGGPSASALHDLGRAISSPSICRHSLHGGRSPDRALHIDGRVFHCRKSGLARRSLPASCRHNDSTRSWLYDFQRMVKCYRPCLVGLLRLDACFLRLWFADRLIAIASVGCHPDNCLHDNPEAAGRNIENILSRDVLGELESLQPLRTVVRLAQTPILFVLKIDFGVTLICIKVFLLEPYIFTC